jgi:ubiquinone/menaquinone biosynthesis C-methylase UbiE
MSKPIFDPKFWADRIRAAEQVGQDHLSVYNFHSMAEIDKAHKEILFREIPKGSMVLDAGCGYGRMSHLFNPMLYTGVDFSKEFIEKAKKRNPSCLFMQDDLRKLPFRDGTFDVAFAISMKLMVRANAGEQEWLKMLGELRRVADKILILEYAEPEKYESIQGWPRSKV